MKCPSCGSEYNEVHDTNCPSCGFPLRYIDPQFQDLIYWLKQRLVENSQYSPTFEAQNYESFSNSEFKELQKNQRELEKIIKKNQEINKNINNLGHNQAHIIYEVKELDKKIEENEKEQLNIKRQLSTLEQRLVAIEEQNSQLSTLEQRLVAVEQERSQTQERLNQLDKLSTKLAEIEEYIEAEQEVSSRSNTPQYSSFNSEEEEVINPKPATVSERKLSLAEHKLVKKYNDERESFNNANQVSETEQSSSDRRLGKSKIVILANKRRGNYWIVEQDGITYLIPSNNLRVNQYNVKTVEFVFECLGYQPNMSSHFKLLQPAIVRKTLEGNNWQLEKPGIVQF
ncbi:hypothetical protein [Crocosphaera sp.]|uniref:hypothetical protein n=1 Tax=Crocosphaera sp. TaxID=2729996 RepID=UPI00261D6CFC|nr:hypothetical protein [Crocosphaera sp.]MDJ0581744.1 hypothetical protein [Crocosphaera sp.]